jgi:hypothetical protein
LLPLTRKDYIIWDESKYENKIHNNMGKWGTVNPVLRGHLGDKEKVVF